MDAESTHVTLGNGERATVVRANDDTVTFRSPAGEFELAVATARRLVELYGQDPVEPSAPRTMPDSATREHIRRERDRIYRQELQARTNGKPSMRRTFVPVDPHSVLANAW